MKLRGFKVFDETKQLKVDKIEKINNTIKYSFNRIDKSKNAKIDPIWIWQPDSTEGKDSYTHQQIRTTNYGSEDNFYIY